MYAITSLIAIFGAGRQSKPTHTTHIDTADVITGLGTQFTEDTPVAQSPVQEIKVADDKEAIAHSSASKKGRKVRRLGLPAVLKKWKVGAAKKISKEKVPDAETEYMKRLLHHAAYLVAFREENERARLELKTSVMTYCTSEKFDAIFPPSLHYISEAWAQDISRNVWEELFARN